MTTQGINVVTLPTTLMPRICFGLYLVGPNVSNSVAHLRGNVEANPALLVVH